MVISLTNTERERERETYAQEGDITIPLRGLHLKVTPAASNDCIGDTYININNNIHINE